MAHSVANARELGSNFGPHVELPPMEMPLTDRRTWFPQPLREGIIWYETLRCTFGDRFLYFLIVTFFGLKGLSSTLIQTAMLPMFKAMHADGNTFQLATMVAMIPWAMKGWMGVLSDCFPIFRYHKRGYLVMASGLGLTGILGLLLSDQLGYGIWVGALFFSLINLQFATFDLLCEGKYTELMKDNGGASEAVSFAWSSVSVGMLFGSILTLFLVDSSGFRALLSFTVPVAAISLGMALRGDLPESRLRPGRGGVQWVKLMSEPRLFALAASMAVGAVFVAASAVAFSSEVQLVVVLSVSIGLVALAYKALPRTLARSNLYMFLVSVAYLDLNGPLGYYYTGNSRCVPNGPGFSYGYYLAVTNIVGAIGGCIGSVLFQGMQSWSFRQAFWLTTFVQIIASLFDWIIVQRLNIAVGISDQAMFLFGDAACQQIAAMLVIMPSALLTSLLCPRGAEATVYAILAGFQNFGFAVASVLGVSLTRYFEIRAGENRNPDECDFTNLGNAIVIGHCVLPLFCLPLTWFLVPNVRMNDERAFELVSPAPSFRSPGSSAPSSPAGHRDPYSGDSEDEAFLERDSSSHFPYVAMEDGAGAVVMTGFRGISS